MVASRLQFSFFFTRADGSLYCSAYDSANNDHLNYCISPDGTVYQRSETFPFRGWKYLPAADADAIRNIAVHSQYFVPNYRA